MNIPTQLVQELSVLGWPIARLTLLSHFMITVIQCRTVNLKTLANVFDTEAQVDSNYKRLQRFFRSFKLDQDSVSQLLGGWLKKTEGWIVYLDRTNWKIGKVHINLLVLAVSYQGVAIPLMWTSLGKAGNSNTEEHCLLLTRFIRLFGVSRIRYLTADREFRGKKWLLYLKTHRIPFVVRIPNNTQVINRHKTGKLRVTCLFPLGVGKSLLLNRPRIIWGVPVYLAAIRLDASEYCIVASYDFRENILAEYQR